MENRQVLLPEKLTAENGAKALLIGEFTEKIIAACPVCEINGYDELCENCDGSGDYAIIVPISWAMIKGIYSRIVAKLGVEKL